jgi:hypothetical protein
MACSPCEKRRRIIAEARKKAGFKGVIRIAPAIVRDTVRNPPSIMKKGKSDG